MKNPEDMTKDELIVEVRSWRRAFGHPPIPTTEFPRSHGKKSLSSKESAEGALGALVGLGVMALAVNASKESATGALGALAALGVMALAVLGAGCSR